MPCASVTRTHKVNTPDYQAIADGKPRQVFLPKYFAKSGYEGQDPKKTKKNGGGKGNWGTMGDEALDNEFNFAKPRRRSNSSSISSQMRDFKTKFDINETDPVFEEYEEDEDYAASEPSESGSSIN
ncbi:hypothetical protein jhhlp_006180 [Lomentospora prolificans]|uniref:Hyaluronan/mRNA-binding protein domain-containing protein n=1 Tax=Lomentospora prolificans TaxID=41688 RepID=A0A2N3N576_9PEZI|nr:hypothetical protein jhhlp_006180 [Lomentospora prolificans]